jgi:hypothetical protein
LHPEIERASNLRGTNDEKKVETRMLKHYLHYGVFDAVANGRREYDASGVQRFKCGDVDYRKFNMDKYSRNLHEFHG